MRRNALVGLAGSLSLALVLGACASGAAAPTSGSTVTPTVPPTGTAALFTGHELCASGEGNGNVTCTRTATDARLTGTFTSSKADGSGTDPKYYSEWRSFVMTNDGGTWTCKQFMLGAMDTGTGFVDQICTGAGGYAGLTAYVHLISSDAANHFGLIGWVDRSS